MIKRITSIIITLSLIIALMPQALANNVTEVLMDLQDFYQYPGTTSSADRNYNGFLYPRHGHVGHYFDSSALAGKQKGDQRVTIMAKAPEGQDIWINMNPTGDTTAPAAGQPDPRIVDVENNIVVFSFEVYHQNRLAYIYAANPQVKGTNVTSTPAANVLGKVITKDELSDDKFDTITIVYIPQTDGTIVTESYINNKLHSTKINPANSVEGVILAMDAVAGQESNGIQFDNFKIVTVDAYAGPQLDNADYIKNGEVVDFYGMTAAELKAALATTGVELSVVDNKGNAVEDTANVFTGMKVISKVYSLDIAYTAEYPLASGQSDVEKAIAAVDIPEEATSDLTLPTQIGGASISWISSVPEIISNTGTVVRPPASDVVVTLTANFEDAFMSETKTYTVVVMSQGLQTSVNTVNVILSGRNAAPGQKIGYSVRQIDDYGSWDLRYTVASEDEEIVIDEENKTITSSVAGVYKVTFTGVDRDFEQTEVVAFGTSGGHHIFEATEVYSENFDGDEYDPNPVLPNASIVTYNDSKAVYANSKNMNQSEAFGPKDENGNLIPLSDYTFEADIYVDKSVGTSTQNFTVRMRDTNTDPVTRTGYNFSFMDYAYLSPTNPGIIGTAETGDYAKYKSVFGFSKGYGGTVHSWHFGSTKQLLEIYNSSNRGFKKSYHIKCTVIEDTMSATIYDGSDVLSIQVVDLKDLDNGTSRIAEGVTRIMTEYTGGYVDNIVISTPERWISSLKLEIDDTTLSPSEPTTQYKVMGKSAGGEWIELGEDEYTLVLSDESSLSVVDGAITANAEGVYSVAAYVGNLCYVGELSCDEKSTQKDAVSDLLVIENADAIRGDFTLPQVPDAILAWEVSDSENVTISGNTAIVTRPAPGSPDKKVSLIVTAYCEGFVVQKTIPIVILAEVDEDAILDSAIKQVVIPTSTTSNITLPTVVGNEGVTVTWSSNSTAISNTGVVTRASSDQNVTLTAVYKRGTAEKTVTYVVNVPGLVVIIPGAGSSSNNKPNSYIPSGTPSGTDYDEPVATPTPASKGFSDVREDAWYHDEVLRLYEKGIIDGVSDKEFQPERRINREEFIKLLCTAANIPTAQTDRFADVSGQNWFAPYVGGAVAAGIVSGISDDMFGAGLEISRQDMCVMIKNALAYNGTALEAENYEKFADSADIKDYAEESVYVLRQAGIVNGKDGNVFDPSGKTTRAEAAAIILRMIELVAKQ